MAEEALGPPASHHSCLPSIHVESRTVLSTTEQTACKWDGVWPFGCWVVRVGGWSDWFPVVLIQHLEICLHVVAVVV